MFLLCNKLLVTVIPRMTYQNFINGPIASLAIRQCTLKVLLNCHLHTHVVSI